VSWPAELEPLFVSREQGGPAVELSSNTPEFVEALRHDRQALVRDALLWQRWVRYIGLATFVIMALAFGRESWSAMLRPLAITSLLYLACVVLATAVVRRARAVHRWHIPAFLTSADVIGVAAMIWLSGAPTDAVRILVAAVLVVQLAVFYFGWGLGIYSAVLAGLAYLVVALVVPPHMPGPRPDGAQVAYTLGLFALVTGVLIAAYGDFRARMNRLRLFCKLIEDGDLAPALPVGDDRRPDDLTLLARSFESMRSRLAEQVGSDPLTGCLNRRALETRLQAEWRQAKRRGSTVAVLAIDVDDFKKINDERGHPFGDAVLRELADIMKSTARDTDAVARVGGDEFVIVLPDTGWQGALTFAERIRRKVVDFHFGGATSDIDLTISIGVALARGTDPVSPDVLLNEADRTMYKAKNSGKNRIYA
jgi:diguanylate cyclase (GGDEF)-like protein